MRKVYVQLGRVGDICNILPFLWTEAQKGQKPALMVAAEFAPLLDGVSYVEPIIHNGPHYEIAKACQKVSDAADIPCCCQVNGPMDQVREWTYKPSGIGVGTKDSFQKESWFVAGKMKEWDDQPPLKFDRRDTAREQALLTSIPRRPGRRSKDEKLILVNTQSISSPFPYVDLLWELLRLKLTPGYRLLDLKTVKADRFYDLLALYEKAHCLISVDSAPLHLARALPKLPVIALTQDRPLLWNGSAFQPNWVWCSRYRDWPKRALEMFSRIECGPEFLNPHIIRPLHYDLGMFGRDSQNTLKDQNRVPYLRDYLRASIRRGTENVIVARQELRLGLIPPEPCYAYRMNRNGKGDTFHPVADMFSAPRDWWKQRLPEIPDLLMGKDYWWSEALRVLFQKHGAKDVTGVCYRESKK